MSEKLSSFVVYYAREGYARQLQTVCKELLKRQPNDALVLFWKAFGLMMEGSHAEALRELQGISNAPDVELAATAAMIMAHEAAKVQDQETIFNLRSKLEVAERASSDASVRLLATFYWLQGSRERARGLIERVVRGSDGDFSAQTILGWVILAQEMYDDDMLNDMSDLDEAVQLFNTVLAQQPSDYEACLGKAKCLELQKQIRPAIDVLTEVWVRNQWFLPALMEKAKLLLAAGDWDQLQDCIARITQADPQNILALTLSALVCVVRDGSNKVATKYLQDALAAINRFEPKNTTLCYNIVVTFSRLAGQDTGLQSVTSNFADKMLQLKPDEPSIMVEWAYQKLQTGETAAAQEKFLSAVQIDELNKEANYGMVECQIASGELNEAESQLQFLQEMVSTSSTSGSMSTADEAHLQYLHTLLAFKQGSGEAVVAAEKALSLQLQTVAGKPSKLEMYAELDPSRILSLVRLMLQQVGGDPRSSTEAPSPLLSKCTRALEMLARYVPGLSQASALYAQTLYLNGQMEAAERKATDLLRTCPDDYMSQLLVCKIYLYQGKHEMAMGALEQAVSSNFAVRETSSYHIVHGQVLMANNQLDEARKVLEGVMNMPGVRTPLTQQQRTRLARKVSEATLHERATAYLLLAELLTKTSRMPDPPEAKKYITDAIREFEGTSEEVRVTIADCQMAIARGDVEGALKSLRKIPSTSPHFLKARMAMADIYLKHRRDKAAYIKCYMDLKSRNPSYESCCMLGEALLHIQEPEKAIQEFEEAMETYNPKDGELSAKIGRALVVIHEYQRAVDFYNKAIRNTQGDTTLMHELATLLVRLRLWSQAEAALKRCVEKSRESAAQGTENLQIDVQTHLLMAKVQRGMGNVEGYVTSHKRALELQETLLLEMRGELSGVVAVHKEKAAEVFYELAQHYSSLRKHSEAIEIYKQALRHMDSHLKSLQALAKLHLGNGDVDACQQTCAQLLKIDPNNEEAAIMMAELMFHRENYDSATYHFQQLLEKSPRHYQALSQLVSLLKRAGRLQEVPRYFQLAENSHPKATMDAGLHYCKGLYHRYMNEPREALTHINHARSDTQWGTPAILDMVEIYLNPDNDAIWQEKETSSPETQEALSTARSLLQQVRATDTGSIRYKVLECYAMMATRGKSEIEAALNRLHEMANEDANNVPLLLCMASAFTLQKQTPKARNQLKRVAKIPYKPAEAEEFERSWLLLADIHIQGGKYDLAQELCQRCLKYNKSCAAAWETLGAIMEREQSYKDASDHYESAWKFQHFASPQVGYKLAFNYLKAKRFVEAIDVCNKVIKAFPDYPKIQKDILEKARASLKP